MAAKKPRYGLWRDLASVTPNWDKLIAAGITPLFNIDKPELLAKYFNEARAHGVNPGLWAPAGHGWGPEQLAQMMGGYINQYHPSMVNLNVEAEGKGYPGSAGWEYDRRLADAYSRIAGNQLTSISPMGWQDDFNYGVFANRGYQIWPQAYNGDMSPLDPQKIAQQVILNKVDPSLVTPMLGRGQNAWGHLYALEDWNDQYPNVEPPGYTPPGAPTAVRTGDVVPASAITGRVPDAQNPAAIAYARKRLAQAVGAGLQVPKGWQGAADPTAIWRNVSKQVVPTARLKKVTPLQLLRAAGKR